MEQEQTSGVHKIGAVLSKRGKVTATGANLQLRMEDNNIVMLRGGSSFRVDQYKPDANATRVKRFDYAGGVLRPSRRRQLSS